MPRQRLQNLLQNLLQKQAWQLLNWQPAASARQSPGIAGFAVMLLSGIACRVTALLVWHLQHGMASYARLTDRQILFGVHKCCHTLPTCTTMSVLPSPMHLMK